MSKEDPRDILRRMAEKIEKNEKRQAELKEKNEELEKRIAVMNGLLSPSDAKPEEKPSEPEPVKPAVEEKEDPVQEWARKQMIESEEKKERLKRSLRVKSRAEIEADADRLFQEMLLDGLE